MRRSPGSGVAIKNSARLINGRRSAADGYAQFVPAHRVPITARTAGAASINRNIMRCPQPSISDVRRKQSVVERIQPNAARNRLHTAAVRIRCARDWERCRVYSDRDICRNARRAAGTADSAHDQSAERGVARTDDVAFSRVWIVVINTAGTIGSLAITNGRCNQSAEGGDNDWPASHDRSFLNNIDVGVVKIPARRVEHIAAHVESVGVDTERVVIEKLVRVGVTDGILLDREKRPYRAVRDNAVTCRVRNRNQDAVGLVPDAARRAARNVDHRQEPPLRYAVITNLRVARKINSDAISERRHHALEENIGVDIHNAVCHPRFGEGSYSSVHVDNELGRSGGAH
jgi:hypothetical protein